MTPSPPKKKKETRKLDVANIELERTVMLGQWLILFRISVLCHRI